MYILKLGKSIGFGSDFYEELDKAVQLGFDSLDFGIATDWADREKEIETYKTLEQGLIAIKAKDIFLNAVHISFGPNWDYSCPDETKRLEILNRTKEVFQRIDAFNPNCYVIHGSFEPIADDVRHLHIKALKKSLVHLKSLTNTTICLENLPRTCIGNTAKEINEIVDSVGGLKVCVDTNHFLQEKTEDAILEIGHRIYTLHVSDHDYVNERHFMPKKGKIDWMKVIQSLEKVGYNGIFNYELKAELYDVKQNYEELFAQYNQNK